MGKIKEQLPVKFFAAITCQHSVNIPEVIENIEVKFGKIDRKSPIFNFDDFTNYYSSEMGTDLKKLFVSFECLALPELLIERKIQSNKVEYEISDSSIRKVNIDPGYITEAKMILATTKDYSHRIYLGKGIFGDLHLKFEKKSFQPQLWTYPDYQQELSIRFFDEMRNIYRQQLAGVQFETDNI
ncbi:MAG: DUF4416 family protein [Calditrichaceae bacterium]